MIADNIVSIVATNVLVSMTATKENWNQIKDTIVNKNENKMV